MTIRKRSLESVKDKERKTDDEDVTDKIALDRERLSDLNGNKQGPITDQPTKRQRVDYGK